MRSYRRLVLGLLLYASASEVHARLPDAAIPNGTIYVPVTNRVTGLVRPFESFRVLSEAEEGYVVLYSNATDGATVGRIPATDRLGNSSVSVQGEFIQIAPGRHVEMQSGFIPLIKGKEYDIVSRSPTHYYLHYTFESLSRTVAVLRSSCTVRLSIEREWEKEAEDAKSELNRKAAMAAEEEQRRLDAARAEQIAAYGAQQRARGLVKVAGQWYTPEDARKVVAILQQREAEQRRIAAEQAAAARRVTTQRSPNIYGVYATARDASEAVRTLNVVRTYNISFVKDMAMSMGPGAYTIDMPAGRWNYRYSEAMGGFVVYQEVIGE